MNSPPKNHHSSPTMTSSPTRSSRSISPFFYDAECENDQHEFHCDELPVFQLEDEDLSPISSPLQDDSQRFSYDSPCTQVTMQYNHTSLMSSDEETEFVSLEEIHSLIGTPKECQQQRLQQLETIFEGIFLETPPRGNRHQGTPTRMKAQRTIFNGIMIEPTPLEDEDDQQD